MIPIKPLSEHPDAAKCHVAGSQHAANRRIARESKRASKQRNGVSDVMSGAWLEIVIIACVLALCIASIVAFFVR